MTATGELIPPLSEVRKLVGRGNVVPVYREVRADLETPVSAFLKVAQGDYSFLLESVEGGGNVGRHSFLGAQPCLEVLARGHAVTIIDHRSGTTTTTEEADPLLIPRQLTASWKLAEPDPNDPTAELPPFSGGWVGYAGYDTMRYLEPEKLPFSAAPPDDRNLPDLHFGLYREVAVFDHVGKVLHAIVHVLLDEHDSLDDAYDAGMARLDSFVTRLEAHSVPLPAGPIDEATDSGAAQELKSNFTRAAFEEAVETCREYIGAGDAFQIVISQRFERTSKADPFEIYRALRIVNPSPYMIYLQAEGSILVASSPEILCRAEGSVITSRPLAGTRKRGATRSEDLDLERDLLGDAKERAEHVMLVDLGRNDLGRVCELASVEIKKIMEVERYSHVMHLSSTLTGTLKKNLDCWDALRGTLPVGTVSGAPKVRAMQIIDELEPTRRGPYAGGIGFVGFGGDMDIAIALRTMVIPTALRKDGLWTVHLQAGAGIVADSKPAMEYEETVNKAAALGKAIDLAEAAFGG